MRSDSDTVKAEQHFRNSVNDHSHITVVTREPPESERGSPLLGCCHAHEKAFSSVTGSSAEAKQVNLLRRQSNTFINTGHKAHVGSSGALSAHLVGCRVLYLFRVLLPDRLDFRVPLLHYCGFPRIYETVW